MSQDPWQIRLLRKSLKKKEKLEILEHGLPFNPDRRALDLGCAQGILSYYLRRKGGFWVSADQDVSNLRAARDLVINNLVRIGSGPLPFRNASFNLVACLDYLEHLEDDVGCLKEIGRVLGEGGELILVTPRTGNFFVLHKLRTVLGLRLEDFGHKREGYSLEELNLRLRLAGFRPVRHKAYSRFFVEFIELMLNFFYIKVLSSTAAEKLRDGHIRPSTSEEFERQEKNFRLYSLIYPLVWLFSRLDTLLFFHKGYSLMIWARKQELLARDKRENKKASFS